MSLAPHRAQTMTEPEDSPAEIEANARLDTVKDMISAGIAAAREAVSNIGDDRAVAAFERFLASEIRPEPPPAPKPPEPVAAEPAFALPPELRDPLLLGQIARVCQRARKLHLPGGEHDGLRALGAFCETLAAHLQASAKPEGDAA